MTLEDNSFEMKKDIIDYSEYLIENHSYGINKPNSRREIFFAARGLCPFCNCMAKSVVSKGGAEVEKWGPWHEAVLDVWECECGWWQIDSYSYMEEEDRFKDWWHKRISGEIKSFNIADKNIPVNVLRDYLKKHNDDIYYINDRKMEELVAGIFRDYYECDVEIVGKSGDGGVDLILINGDPCVLG